MHRNYHDITDRIPEPPKWWDEAGVPRYCEFHPGEVANIYAKEVAFCLIECAECQRQFKVVISNDLSDVEVWSIPERIRTGALSYANPPNVGCCDAGAVQTSEMVAVLEYWESRGCTPDEMMVRGVVVEWTRDSTLEKVFNRSGQ